MKRGPIPFEEWQAAQRAAPLLFEEASARDCAQDGHLFEETVTTWPGEVVERLTWTCATCGEVRGRC